MKKRKNLFLLLVLILSFSMIFSACGVGTETQSEQNPSAENITETETEVETEAATTDEEAAESEINTDISGDVTIWTWWPDSLEASIPGFNKIYPNVKINFVKMENRETHEKVLTAIAAGTGAPDIVSIDHSRISNFNTIDGLEDLLQPPYNAGRYQADFTKAQWERFISLDGKKLIAFPWDFPPAVSWYRADILEENGFPSEPEELGAFMEDPENWIDMASTLKANDKYILQYDTEAMDIFTMGTGFFDHDLNYVRQGDNLVKGLDLAKRVKQLGLASNLCMWCEDGQQAMDSGKLAMIYSGSWMADCCMKQVLPNSAGKWRVTKLPFGIYGGYGGSSLAIPSQSQNKEAAWAFIEYTMATLEGQIEQIKTNNMPGYKPAWNLPDFAEVRDEFVGDQALNVVFASLVDKIPPIALTPLDAKAAEIWSAGIKNAIENNHDSLSALQKIQEDIKHAVEPDKIKYLEAMGK